jgi:hypothetical protein
MPFLDGWKSLATCSLSMTFHNADHQRTINWQRLMIGTMAWMLGLFGLLVHWLPGIDAGSVQFIAGTAWKVAVVLAIAWLASPQLERMGWQKIRGTMLIALTIVIILYAIRPKIGAVAAVLLISASVMAAAMGWMRRLLRSPRS